MSTNGTKTIKGRIQNKHGTEEFWILSVYKSLDNLANWNKRENPFIPLHGELIIYDPVFDGEPTRFKFGNGVDDVVALPFVDEYVREELDRINSWLNSPRILEPVTWNELISRRNSGELVPGLWYRLIDYEFTPNNSNLASAGHKFDIVLQATSRDHLSEIAKVQKHQMATFAPDVVKSNGEIEEGSINIAFHELVDENGSGFAEDYKDTDVFIAGGYDTDNHGNLVPVLYKTDTHVRDDGEYDYIFPDYEDPFYFIGKREVDGDIYDVWRKISIGSEDMHWDGERKHYVYTEVITIGDYYEEAVIDETNISAWQVKYCLDNDTNRFNWASRNGKGVIYWMKDEYNNECPYDFKNLKYKKNNEYIATFADNEEKSDYTLFGCVTNCKIGALIDGSYVLPHNIVICGIDNLLNNMILQPGSNNLFIELPDGGDNITFCAELRNKEIIVSDDNDGTSDLVYRSGTITEVYLN